MTYALRLVVAFCATAFSAIATFAADTSTRKPNIVFILADDLGYGDIGCYGQKHIRTPNIDRLASEGMRFTQHYAGSNVCAPSRCALMTGLHSGHTFIRENIQAKGYSEGQTPVPADSLRLPLLLKHCGYTIGGFGKWGLGPVGSSGDPLKQGFDRWFGYNCQAVAHNYYPTHLWDNDKPFPLDNPKFSAYQKLAPDTDRNSPASYSKFRGNVYAPDVIAEQALSFVRENKHRPFFLYFPTTVPHLALQVPEDSLQKYLGKFPEVAYTGDRGYLPQRTPRAAYAAMITRMDREVGRIVDLVKEFGLDSNTIFVFASDNGPATDRLGGADTEFFKSANGFRGRKGACYEGGIRIPCIVRWQGKIAPNTVQDRVTGFEDWLPTLLELVGQKSATPADIDGISFAPTLLGKSQPPREFLYRESPGYGGQQSVRVGNWKAIRTNLNPPAKSNRQAPGSLELYDLSKDPSEKVDVAAKHPDVVANLQSILNRQHRKSELFPIRALDGP